MKKLGILMAMVFVLAMVVSAWAQPYVSLNPEYAQRNLGGKVRMHIEMTGATELLSMGVKVTFPADKLQVDTAEKNTDVWKFADLEPDPKAYLPEVEIKNTEGTVTMIGGRLEPGVSGEVLLGWIVFNCSNTNTGTATVTVDLAKPDPYDNFVRQGSTPETPLVDDDDIVFNGAIICIVTADACEGDFGGDGGVTMPDSLVFRAAYPSVFGDAKYNPACDFNADGGVTMPDSLVFRGDYPRTDCPNCP